ncbi:MAG: hypothetical protein AAGH90_02770 [Pseudomonadota bacterium]
MSTLYHETQGRVGYIWRPALHYGLAYTVFALTNRALREETYASPALFLAGFGIGSFLILAWTTWQGYRRRERRAGPAVRWTLPSIASGLAAIAIVAATVMAFLFEDVSILLALVLMRLGVLILAPIIDVVTGRAMSRAGLVAAIICGLGCVFGGVSGAFEPLSPAVLTVLSVYLTGYAIRLSLMTRYAKTPVRSARGDWFIVEVQITAGVLLLVGLVALSASTVTQPVWLSLDGQILGAALICGLAYGYAFTNGTLIYLDWRENVRAVTINRSASLLAGVAASLIGWAILAMPMPAGREWVLAAFMVAALVIMGTDSLRQAEKSPSR